MKTPVYFTDQRASMRQNIPDKIALLLAEAGLDRVVEKGDKVAIKLHFGEKGNTAFVRPLLVRRLVEEIRALGGSPYLTDTCTLYPGSRSTGPSHMETAIANGFSYACVSAPLIPADGILGSTGKEIEVNLPVKKAVTIAEGIADADCLVVVSHFKCHELTGIGGAIKNLGMGCSTRKGKLDMHEGAGPKIKAEKCILCGNCVDQCGFGAATLGEESAEIDEELCVGCGECLAVCPEEAVTIRWSAAANEVMAKMAEYAYGAVNGKRCLYLTFITQVSPACDCYAHADTPIVADIGMTASQDPVAIDRACTDLVNAAEGMPGSALKSAHAKGADKIRDVYPEIDWTVQLDHGEKIGLGTQDYELIKLETKF